MPTNTFTIAANVHLTRSDDATRDVLRTVSKGLGELTLASMDTVKIPTGDDLAVPFGTLTTAKVVYIETDEEVTVLTNGDTTGFSLVGGGVVLLFNVEVTSLTIDNQSGSVAYVRVYLLGV